MAAIGIVIAVAVADSLRSNESSPAQVAAPEPDLGDRSQVPARPSRQQRIREIADGWIRNFADGVGGCEYMTQPLCEQIACERVGDRKIANCRPPTHGFRRSFDGALVLDVAFKGNRAAARLSNGKVIEFWGDAGTWLVHRIGATAGRGFFAARAATTDHRE